MAKCDWFMMDDECWILTSCLERLARRSDLSKLKEVRDDVEGLILGME